MAERLTAMELELVQRIDELTLKVDATEQEVERLREALVESQAILEWYVDETGQRPVSPKHYSQMQRNEQILHEQRKGEDG